MLKGCMEQSISIGSNLLVNLYEGNRNIHCDPLKVQVTVKLEMALCSMSQKGKTFCMIEKILDLVKLIFSMTEHHIFLKLHLARWQIVCIGWTDWTICIHFKLYQVHEISEFICLVNSIWFTHDKSWSGYFAYFICTYTYSFQHKMKHYVLLYSILISLFPFQFFHFGARWVWASLYPQQEKQISMP